MRFNSLNKEVKKMKNICCSGKQFPTCASILLIIGVWWLLEQLNIISMKLPFWPLLFVIVGFGLIINHQKKGEK